MNIRLLDRKNPAEMKQLYAIYRAAYEEEAYLLGVSLNLFFPLQAKLIEIEQATDEIFTAEENGKLMGAIFLEHLGSSTTISTLIVDPVFFRRGIGKALLKASLDKYHDQVFLVGTGVKNLPAVHLYKKFNFEIVSEETVDPDIDVVKLRRAPQK